MPENKKLTDEELDRIVEALDRYSRFNQVVQVKKLTEDAHLPTQGRESDFAFDLYLSEDLIIPPSLLSASMGKTGIATSFDWDRWGLFISPRSSIFRLPLILTNSTGIIEGTYRGGIGIPLRNTLSWYSYVSANDFDHHYDRKFAIEQIENVNGDKIYRRKPISEIPKETLLKAKEIYDKESSILGIEFNFIKDDPTFVTTLPVGTIFLPKGFRITQCYLVPKVHTIFQEISTLPESERGENGFGSSGTGYKNGEK